MKSARFFVLISVGPVLLAPASVTAQVSATGSAPYVVRVGAGLEEWSHFGGAAVNRTAIKVGDVLTVPAVGRLPAFTVALRPAAGIASAEATPVADAPIFVMADSHGQFEIAADLLQKHGVIDARLKWSFGRGTLIVLGDVFDRGPHHTEMLWFLYQLEADARRAGGSMHVVLGNHEVMVMTGDLRYLHPRYVEEAKALGVASYIELWGKDSVLGQWLRSRSVVFKLGRTLFLHGGISVDVVKAGMSLADLNRIVRERLNDECPKDDEPWKFVYGPMGPLWYRGYFPDQPKLAQAKPEEVEAACKFYDVDRIVVGHTIVPQVTALYSGRVVAVNVNIERNKDGHPIAESLLMKNGAFLRAKISGEVEPLKEDAP